MLRTSLARLPHIRPRSGRSTAATAPWASLALVLSAAACGGAHLPGPADVRPAADIALYEGDETTAVRELAARFYAADAAAWEQVGAELEAAAKQGPSSALLHEALGYRASIHEDTHARWKHFLAAAADLRSAHTELYVAETVAGYLSVDEVLATIGVFEALRTRHPRSTVRVEAARQLVDLYTRMGELDRAERVGKSTDLIRDFSLIGPFDNDQGKGFLSEYEPEKSDDLTKPVRALRGTATWRPALMERDGTVAFGAQLWPSSWTLGYLVTHVRAPRAMDAELRLTTSTSVRAWVNGALVASEELIDGENTDNVVVPVHLEAGWNRLLLKSADRNHAWALGARITAAGGAPLGELAFSRDAKPWTRATGGGAKATAASQESPAARATDVPGDAAGERRMLLALRRASLFGFDERALPPARGYLAAAPRSPVATYYGALAHSANGEGGKAIDLYNHGAELLGERGTAFLRQRARYQADKERWDRALVDYKAALAANPRARTTRLNFAELLGRRGWHVERCAEVQAILQTWPHFAQAQREYAQCLVDRGYYPAAEAAFSRALALEPGSAWTLSRAAFLASERYAFDEALALSDRALRADPVNPNTLFTKGELLRKAGRRDEARRAFEDALRINPTWSKPHGRLGLMALEDGQDEAALAAWREALAREPDDTALAEHMEYLRAGDSEEFAPFAPGRDAFDAAVANAPKLAPMPGAHSVVAMDDEVTLVATDGSSRSLVSTVSYAYTTEGRDALLQTRVPRNARVLTAFALTKEGTRLEASSVRDGVIRFRGVEVGTTVAVQFVVHRRAGGWLPNHYVGDWYFQGINQQFARSRWVVVLPEDRELATYVRGNIQHTKETVGGRVAHTFLAENVPPLHRESNMGPAADLLWRVDLGTLLKWDEYVLWERALLADVFEGSEKLDALAKKLTEGKKTAREKMDALFAHVAEEIRYQQDYESTIAGVKPHTAAAVIERGYGDCKDKAVLLIVLARALGIDVHFALIKTRDAGQVIEAVPNQQFNHAIAYVPKQDGIEEGYFIDATTDGLDVGNLRGDDQGTRSLVLDPKTGAFSFIPVPYAAPDHERLGVDIEMAVTSPTTATSKLNFTFRGSGASSIRRVIRNPADATRLYQNIANAYFAGATVTASRAEHADDIWKRLSLSIEADTSASVQPQAGAYRIPVPSPFKLGNAASESTRKLPVHLGVPDISELHLAYSLPRRAKVRSRPSDVRVEHPCFTARRTSRVKGSVVHVDYTVTQRCTEIATAEYPAFREAIQRAANQLTGELLVELPTAQAKAGGSAAAPSP